MPASHWLQIIDVAALVFAVGVYGFIGWRSWRSRRIVPALLDGMLALIFAATAFASSRHLFAVDSPWLGQVLFSAIVALPALRALNLWMEARTFISVTTEVLNGEGVSDDD